MGVLTFNGISSGTYGLYVRGKDTFNAPELDFERIAVPGKSGDVLISNNRYKNIVVPYDAYIHKDFKTKAANVRAWLLSSQGYCRLTDEFHPEYFRLAIFKGPLDFDVRLLNRSGTCTLEFDCKPQRFLTSGESSVTASKGGNITNPTLFEAKPLITVTTSSTSAATLTINGYTIKLSSVPNRSATLDCETQNAYYGTTNLNGYVTGDFPILKSGANSVTWSGSVSKVTLVPRWWTL